MTATLESVQMPLTPISLDPEALVISIEKFRANFTNTFENVKRLDASTARYYGLESRLTPRGNSLVYSTTASSLGKMESIVRPSGKFNFQITRFYKVVDGGVEDSRNLIESISWAVSECVYLNPSLIEGASYVTLDGQYFTYFGGQNQGYRGASGSEITFFEANESGELEACSASNREVVEAVGYFELSTPISAPESGLARYQAVLKEKMLTFTVADEMGEITTVKPCDFVPGDNYLVWGGVMGDHVRLVKIDPNFHTNGRASVGFTVAPMSGSVSDATSVYSNGVNQSMADRYFEYIDGVSAHNFSPLKVRPASTQDTSYSQYMTEMISRKIASIREDWEKWGNAMNELAEENDWCSEYEGTVQPLGFEGREKGDYEITARVNLSVEYDYSDSPSELDRAISEAVIGGNEFDKLTVTIEVSTLVTVTAEDADNEDDARDRAYDLVMDSIGNGSLSNDDIDIISVEKQ